MNLHQLQLVYQPNEDRILLRLSFKAENEALQEIRAWLTRRLVKNLWPGIIHMLEMQIKLDEPLAAHASTEILGMQHVQSLSDLKASGNFDTNFSDSHIFPLGQTPVLITAAQLSIDANQPVRIHFSYLNGDGFEVALHAHVLHGFCTLLQEAVHNAEWDIELRFAETIEQTPAAHMLN